MWTDAPSTGGWASSTWTRRPPTSTTPSRASGPPFGTVVPCRSVSRRTPRTSIRSSSAGRSCRTSSRTRPRPTTSASGTSPGGTRWPRPPGFARTTRTGIAARPGGLGQRVPPGDVPDAEVVGRGLVRDDVRHDLPADELRIDVRGVRLETDRQGTTVPNGGPDAREGVVEVGGRLVQVLLAQPPVDGASVHIDDQGDPAEHRYRERLGPSHLPEAGAQHPAARQVLGPEVQASEGGEGLVRSLQDPLRSDVDPAAGRHLSVHREPPRLQVPEDRVGGPPRDDHG